MSDETPQGSSARTHWSRLRDQGSEGAADAWEYFYTHYRAPVARLFRRLGLPPGMGRDEIDDLVHTFFIETLRKGFLERADPEKGRFRAYLKTAASRFLISMRRKADAAKRRPANGVVPLEEAGIEPPSGGEDPGREFDLAWARELLDRARYRMAKTLVAGGHRLDYEVFVLRNDENEAWERIAEKTGTPLSTARRRYEKARQTLESILREEVSETVSSPQDLEEEIADLLRILSDAGHANADWGMRNAE